MFGGENRGWFGQTRGHGNGVGADAVLVPTGGGYEVRFFQTACHDAMRGRPLQCGVCVAQADGKSAVFNGVLQFVQQRLGDLIQVRADEFAPNRFRVVNRRAGLVHADMRRRAFP